MKVGKEEMVLLAAVERYLKVDHDAEFKELDSRVQYMIDALSKIPGLTTDRHLPPIPNRVPHLRLTWTEDAFRFDAGEVVHRLMEGEPPIAISRRGERLLSYLRLDDAPRRAQDCHRASPRRIHGCLSSRAKNCGSSPDRPAAIHGKRDAGDE